MPDRTSVLIDMGDLSAPPGSVSWVKGVHFEAKGALNDNESSRELVERWVGALRRDNHFRSLKDSQGRPYLLWSSFCKDRRPFGLGSSEEAIEAILTEQLEPSIAVLDPARAARRIAGRFRGAKLDALIRALLDEQARNSC